MGDGDGDGCEGGESTVILRVRAYTTCELLRLLLRVLAWIGRYTWLRRLPGGVRAFY